MAKRKRAQVFVVQRGSQHRAFENFSSEIRILREMVADVADVRWGRWEDLTYADQVSVAANTQILVGAHGAGLAWTMFQKANTSCLVELIPSLTGKALNKVTGLCANPESWNTNPLTLYGGASRLSSVHHVCLNSNAYLDIVDEQLTDAAKKQYRGGDD